MRDKKFFKKTEIYLLSCVLFFAMAAFVKAEPSSNLEGMWQASGNSNSVVCFFGNQVGSITEGGEELSFKYTSSTENTYNFDFGTSSKTVTIVNSNDKLTITDSELNSKIYSKSGSYTNACQKGIKQILAAKSICKQADSKLKIVAMPDTLKYLKTIPKCPNEGTYLMQPDQEPACTRKCGVEGGAK